MSLKMLGSPSLKWGPHAGQAPKKTAVSDKRRHKHKVHEIPVIYRHTAVLQVSSFVEKEGGLGNENETNERKQEKKKIIPQTTKKKIKK